MFLHLASCWEITHLKRPYNLLSFSPRTTYQQCINMEGIIKAMLDESVSAEEFITFMSNYDIQDHPYIQDIFSQLIMRVTSQYPASPHEWSVEEAGSLLEMLKSPAKAPARAPLYSSRLEVMSLIYCRSCCVLYY